MIVVTAAGWSRDNSDSNRCDHVISGSDDTTGWSRDSSSDSSSSISSRQHNLGVTAAAVVTETAAVTETIVTRSRDSSRQ